MDDDSDSDGDVNKKSRWTQWRRFGPKRRKIAQPGEEPAGLAHCLPSTSGAPVSQGCSSPEDMFESSQPAPSHPSGPAFPERKVSSSESSSESESDRDPLESVDSSSGSYDFNHMEVNFLEEEENADIVNSERDDYLPLEEVNQVNDGADFNGEDEDLIIDNHVSSEEDSDEEDVNQKSFHFGHASLDQVILLGNDCTVRESLLLDMALSVRHSLTYEALMDLFQNKNLIYGSEYFPTSTKELWQILGRSSGGIVNHFYFGDCGSYIKKVKDFVGDFVECPERQCNYKVQRSKARFFIQLKLNNQFHQFLRTDGVAELVRYRETRVKYQADAYEDVFDGQIYKNLQAKGFALVGSNDLTLDLNTDGCKKSKGARTNIYPLYVRINEVRPQLRQKFMFLAAVYVDVAEPKMVSFLKPLMHELNDLGTRGVQIDRPGEANPTVYRFFPRVFCVDGKARYQMLNMSSHCSHYACTMCTIKGYSEGMGYAGRWPFKPDPVKNPPYEERTHEGIVNDMIAATTEGRGPVRGHKGVSGLLICPNIDLRNSNAADDLHIIYECAVPHITDLLLKEAPRVNRNMGYDVLCSIIDERMKKIKTPSKVSRKPGTCRIKNRAQMTGTEWRNWLLYYAVPCLTGLIEPLYVQILENLSHAAYILSLDSITEENLVRAEQCISEFLDKNEEKFGIERTKLNLHALLHFGRSVRFAAPNWCHSTFNFESWNHKIIKTVSSPQGMLLQIVTRHRLHLSLLLALHSQENISEEIRERLQQILSKKRLKYSERISTSVHVLGRAVFSQPTAAEAEVLRWEGFCNVVQMSSYKKIILKSCRYSVANPNSVSKSEDCMVYTYTNTYCTIQKIVVFTNNDGTRTCGMFVSEHDVSRRNPYNIASHISRLLPAENDILHFIKVQEIRSSVVRIPLLGSTYVVPMPNTFEID